MVRVLILALLALGALALIAHSLPVSAPADAMDGVWEGPFDTYDMTGERLSSARMHLELETEAPGVRAVRRMVRHPDGRVEESTGEIREEEGALTWRMVDQEGGETILAGRRQGPAVFWHMEDPASGISRTFREQIVRQSSGDVYTVDGAGVGGESEGRMHLYEGRYRKVGTRR